jgi:hypothetical protein
MPTYVTGRDTHLEQTENNISELRLLKAGGPYSVGWMNEELEKIWKEEVVAYSRYYPGNRLGRIRETNPVLDIRWPYSDSNRVYAVIITSTHSVKPHNHDSVYFLMVSALDNEL